LLEDNLGSAANTSLSHLGGPLGVISNVFGLGGVARTVAGINNRPGDAAAQAGQLAKQQQDSTAAIIDATKQPQNITSDNFLSSRAAMLNKLKMGWASTVTGGGALPALTIGSTKLTGGGGKSTFGS
jgi:hypothetical protein